MLLGYGRNTDWVDKIMGFQDVCVWVCCDYPQEKAMSIWESKNFFIELEPLPGGVEAVKEMAKMEKWVKLSNSWHGLSSADPSGDSLLWRSSGPDLAQISTALFPR